MIRALVVNASIDVTEANRSVEWYNLGARKLADWWRSLGYDVTESPGDPGMFINGYDLVGVSAIFSWHAPKAAACVNRAQESGAEVWVGGTAFSDRWLREWFVEQTGLEPVYKPDDRFDKQRAARQYVYAVRGCEGERLENGSHRACHGCPVPIIEGTTYLLDPKFIPAPNLLDNNLSGMPVHYQDHIIKRYAETGTKLIDAKSGFEPGHFDAESYARWKPVIKGPWRWGFDRIDEEKNASGMAALLTDVPARRKQVYALCGHEPIEVCYERARKVYEWGCEPWVQYMIPLCALDRKDVSKWLNPKEHPEFGWSPALGKAFSRYFNARKISRNVPIWEYIHWRNAPPPFASLKPKTISIALKGA